MKIDLQVNIRNRGMELSVIPKKIFATPSMNHNKKEEGWLATETYFSRIKSIRTDDYLIVKKYCEYTNKLLCCITLLLVNNTRNIILHSDNQV